MTSIKPVSGMRLLYFTRKLSIHDQRFLRAFGEHRFKVGYATLLGSPLGLPMVSPELGCDFGILPGASGESETAAKLKAIAGLFQPDLVLAGPLTDCGYIATTIDFDCPVVLQSWAFDVYWERLNLPGAQTRIEAALARCQALFADCDAVVTACRRIAGRVFETEMVTPWGLDLEAVGSGVDRTQVRRELGWGDELVIVCTRNLEPLYRLDVVLSAFEQVLNSGLKLRLVLTAGGSMMGSLSAWISRRRLTDRVHLLGGISHQRVLSLLGAADGYISAAESDGVSISLLEAMFLGAVPIVSDVGGNPEWVQDGKNGFLARVGSIRDFARAITAFAGTGAEQRRELAEANRNVVVRRANWRANFTELATKLQALARRPYSSAVRAGDDRDSDKN